MNDYLVIHTITDTTALELIKIVHCQSILPTNNVKPNDFLIWGVYMQVKQ